MFKPNKLIDKWKKPLADSLQEAFYVYPEKNVKIEIMKDGKIKRAAFFIIFHFSFSEALMRFA